MSPAAARTRSGGGAGSVSRSRDRRASAESRRRAGGAAVRDARLGVAPSNVSARPPLPPSAHSKSYPAPASQRLRDACPARALRLPPHGNAARIYRSRPATKSRRRSAVSARGLRPQTAEPRFPPRPSRTRRRPALPCFPPVPRPPSPARRVALDHAIEVRAPRRQFGDVECFIREILQSAVGFARDQRVEIAMRIADDRCHLSPRKRTVLVVTMLPATAPAQPHA